MSSLIKNSMSAVCMGASLFVASMGGAQALGVPITLPTTNIDANSTFTFSDDSQYLMGAMGINVSGLGNAKQLAGEALAFDMPVTEVSVLTSLLPPSLKPISGEAMGSALGFSRNGADGFVLANFGMDFKRNVMQADFISNGSTTYAMDVFTFQVDQGLTISMNGGLSLNMSLDHMFLTAGAQSRFSSALELEPYAVSSLGMLDFGSLAVDINPALRFGLSDKAFVASSAVPEAPQVLMMLLGLAGLAAVSHRRVR